MKKIILFAGLLLSTLSAQAQELDIYGNGAPISEGQVYVFNQLSTIPNPQEIKIGVTNNGNTPINLKLRIENIVNNDMGDNVQFCFDEDCYFDIEVGSSVPSTISGLTLAPGESNHVADHFASAFAGDTAGEPVEYTIAVIEVDTEGNQVGNVIRTFKYRYDATADVDDFTSLKNMGITVNNTIVKSTLDINATVNATLNIYSINGQVVKMVQVKHGIQSLDLSTLASAIYIAKFTTTDNKTSQIRIVKN